MINKEFYEKHKNFSFRTILEYKISPGIRCKFDLLKENIKSIRKGIGRPLGGHYAGIIEFGENALVLCTDGVGSKVKIASYLRKWDTIGIDCIAMNVNDAICVGAEPLAFVDYLAIDDPKPEITKEMSRIA